MPRGADDEQALTEDIIALAKQYGRYGYRRVTALLRSAGWTANRKRVERIWRREGLKGLRRESTALKEVVATYFAVDRRAKGTPLAG